MLSPEVDFKIRKSKLRCKGDKASMLRTFEMISQKDPEIDGSTLQNFRNTYLKGIQVTVIASLLSAISKEYPNFPKITRDTLRDKNLLYMTIQRNFSLLEPYLKSISISNSFGDNKLTEEAIISSFTDYFSSCISQYERFGFIDITKISKSIPFMKFHLLSASNGSDQFIVLFTKKNSNYKFIAYFFCNETTKVVKNRKGDSLFSQKKEIECDFFPTVESSPAFANSMEISDDFQLNLTLIPYDDFQFFWPM
ncbi:hypothetical protein TVAG_427660 [Trichomonas vaginalis G3]|uniref:Uncharacterized protein n=1 Tax=Trichomonas vaginalis (strain ATCC PRA-98 / G3) TaxID=412133 RepID=A2F685_TRIV3|nr:hypothetical protein TVAGG3_0660180 [Trichomonas vaginalis G3]EAX99602.1 hypothetical protein TVAG_427660 [Trichomonas vaginalis G3]KAI5506441.1 hypothetical protein TVAGG3_0660180 [Trichomonas vaginalis G3]|eukprot:XP_001312532.1 hypothetical protein [Trichomonas vaginalis G3]